jgi:hypothetical protein
LIYLPPRRFFSLGHAAWKAASKRLEHLLHEIQNNLQVIRMEAELVKTAKSNQIPQCVLDAIQGIEKLLGSKTTFLAPSINIAAVKAIVSASPRLPCNNPSTPRSFILHRNRFICRGEIPKGFAPRPNCFRPSIVSRTTSADGSLSGSPFAPTLSSDLLRFWGEDPS